MLISTLNPNFSWSIQYLLHFKLYISYTLSYISCILKFYLFFFFCHVCLHEFFFMERVIYVFYWVFIVIMRRVLRLHGTLGFSGLKLEIIRVTFSGFLRVSSTKVQNTILLKYYPHLLDNKALSFLQVFL